MDNIQRAVKRLLLFVKRRISFVSINSSFNPLSCFFFLLLSILLFIDTFFGRIHSANPVKKSNGDSSSKRKLPPTAKKNEIVMSNVNVSYLLSYFLPNNCSCAFMDIPFSRSRLHKLSDGSSTFS